MKKKLLISQALIHNPDILILDEPASGLDPNSRKYLFNLLLDLKKKGKTILISSHILSELNEIVDEITVVNLGKIIFSGMHSNTDNKSDLFLKSTDNTSLVVFIKKEFPQFKFLIQNNDEIMIQNLTAKQGDKLLNKITSKTSVSIKSFHYSNLDSIYNKIISQDNISKKGNK